MRREDFVTLTTGEYLAADGPYILVYGEVVMLRSRLASIDKMPNI